MKLSGGMMVTLGFGVFLLVMPSGEGRPFSGAVGVLLILYVLFTARTQSQAHMLSSDIGQMPQAYAPSYATVQRQADDQSAISPSRQRGYNRLMGIFNAQQVVGLPKDQAYARLVPFFGDKRFTRHLLDHPNVERLLGWNQPVAAAAGVTAGMAAQAAAPRNDSWWQEGQAQPAPKPREPASPAPGSVEASTGAFWSSEPSTSTDPEPEPAATPDDFMIGASGGAVCGAAGCDRGVTDFDYRCFTCRQRFCMTHRGAGVDCPACAST